MLSSARPTGRMKMKGIQALRVVADGGVSALVLFVGAGVVNGGVLGAGLVDSDTIHGAPSTDPGGNDGPRSRRQANGD